MIRLVLICDSCKARYHQEPANDLTAILCLRAAAAKEGWNSPRKTPRDYCPSCAKASKAKG